MDAYILGSHGGELPVHLLDSGEPGNRIRAVARLDGPDHDAFYAIETPDEQALDMHVQKVSDAGTTTTHVLITCVAPHCVGPIGNPAGNPSWMPPYERYLLLWIEADHDIAEAMGAAKAVLGEDGVYAASDGKGHVLVELGSNDQQALTQAAEDLAGAVGDGVSAAHLVSEGGFQQG